MEFDNVAIRELVLMTDLLSFESGVTPDACVKRPFESGVVGFCKLLKLPS